MPRGDRTGPVGYGPITGRGAGFCRGFPVPGYLNPIGRGYWGRGRGRGFRHMFYATGMPFWARGMYPASPAMTYPAALYDPKYEAEFLAQEAKILKEQLKEIEARLEELEKVEKDDD